MAIDPHMFDERPTLTKEERLARRRASSRLAMEARRRATQILITRYPEEYDELYNTENWKLRNDPKYRL